MQTLLYIFLGGGLGSVCRYALLELYNRPDKLISFGTLIANIAACFILGLIIGYETKSNIQLSHKLLIATGFCGGFSTFSTFSAELVQHINDGELTIAFIYISLSLLLGIASVFVGIKLMQLL